MAEKMDRGEEKERESFRSQPTGTVLIVDDEDLLRDVLSGTLERAGFRIFTAKDGVEALELFKERGDEIDVVLLDLHMPRLSGKEAFHKLRRIRPDVQIILLSGSAEEDAAEQFENSNLTEFLQKPFLPRDLIEKIRALLRK